LPPVNKHLPILIPLAERTQSHRSETLYHYVQFRNVHIKHWMFQMLRAYCGMRRADRKETAGCITRMTSGYTSILLLQVCQAGNLPVTNIPVRALNFTTNFMLQVIPWKLVAGYMVNKLPVFITGEGTLPASQSLPRGSVLSQFNSVQPPTRFFLTLISTVPTIYLYIGFISHFFS
jgi:hypothetical protein